MPSELWVFSCLTSGTDNISCPVWVPYIILFHFGVVLCLALGGFLTCQQLSVLHWILTGGLLKNLQSPFLLCFLVLQALAAFISPESHHCFLSSGNLQYTVQVLSLYASSKLGQFAHSVSLTSLRDHCILLINVQCLEHHCVSYFWMFWLFQAGK